MNNGKVPGKLLKVELLGSDICGLELDDYLEEFEFNGEISDYQLTHIVEPDPYE